MQHYIYRLPDTEDIIKLDPSKIDFNERPNPKLIKYGFNDLSEKIDIPSIKSDEHYREGLSYDFGRNDKNSISAKVKQKLGVKDFNTTFAELWEIFTLFDLLDKDQKILSNQQDIVKNIITAKKSKHKAEMSSKDIDLVVQKYSDMEIEENSLVDIIYNDLKNILDKQKKGSRMVLQLFSTQTQISAELIYYLISLYDNAYLMRPNATSDLSDEKYIILLGLKEVPKISLPELPKDMYLSGLGISSIPNSLTTVIQCINGDLIPRKIETYMKIKNYVNNKIFNGLEHDRMITEQDDNTEKWLNVFTDSVAAEATLQEALAQSKRKCDHTEKWNNYMNQVS